MIEIYLTLTAASLTAAHASLKKKPKPLQPLSKTISEPITLSQSQKEIAEKFQAGKFLVLTLPALFFANPLVAGGFLAGNCIGKKSCQPTQHIEIMQQTTDQYLPTLINPAQAAKAVQPNLQFFLWLGVIFVYLQLALWVYAVYTLIEMRKNRLN